MSTANNIRRLFLNLQTPVDNPGGRAILSLDAAKAFDSVEWPCIWEILAHFGLGDKFVNWVKILYLAPRARLCINNTLSQSFALHRGTRQWCPLMPLLFALAVEPLAILTRGSSKIVGFHRGPSEKKISLYADDALLYLGLEDTTTSLLMALRTRFGKFSGFSINWSKSTLMPLDPMMKSMPQEAGQITTSNSFRYLGEMVTPDTPNYLELHLSPLLDKQRDKSLS